MLVEIQATLPHSAETKEENVTNMKKAVVTGVTTAVVLYMGVGITG